MTKTKPVCVQCNATESLLWRPLENGEVCNDCYTNEDSKKDITVKADSDETNSVDVKQDSTETTTSAGGKVTRKSTRSTRYKLKNPGSTSKPGPPKGRGRRSLFKRPPLKAPTATATIVTSDSVYFKVNLCKFIHNFYNKRLMVAYCMNKINVNVGTHVPIPFGHTCIFVEIFVVIL